jgi:hypothetical protein
MLELFKLKVIGDALVYTEPIENRRCWLRLDNGRRYPLLADLAGIEGEIMSRLLAYYRKTERKYHG